MQTSEIIELFYHGSVPEIKDITMLDADSELKICTLRWKEIVSKKTVTVKAYVATEKDPIRLVELK
jgi:hypothetical protein